MSQYISQSRNCIICGTRNPIGLNAEFVRTETGVQSRVVAPTNFQGFDGVVHGGVVAGLLDDAMWFAALAAGLITVTAELTVRYKHSAPVERPLIVQAHVESRRRNLCVCYAEMKDEAGTILANAKGQFLKAPPEVRETMVASLDS